MIIINDQRKLWRDYNAVFMQTLEIYDISSSQGSRHILRKFSTTMLYIYSSHSMTEHMGRTNKRFSQIPELERQPWISLLFFRAVITILGLITITASAEFDFDVGYEEFVRINPDKTFWESEIGLYVGWTEGGQRQITTIPHNSTLAASLQE